MLPIVLASSSAYRRQLLQKLGLPFTCQAPDIDETIQPDESAETLVRRLARQKAEALRPSYTSHLIIGSDQVAVLDGKILGKPGDFARAKTQLLAASGNKVTFFTGLCLLNTATSQCQLRCERYSVIFRHLSESVIDAYLIKDKPFDCAGSFKAEGLGIALFSRLEGDDPNTLIGLPLIALVDMLANEGIAVPG